MKPIACLFLIFFIASSTQAQPWLHTARQTYIDARLAQIEPSGTLFFQQAGQPLSMPLDKIVRWSSERTVQPSTAVALADGSWLAGPLQWMTDRRVRIVSKWFEPIEVDLDDARAVLMNPSASWSETQSLQDQMLRATGSQDVLWKRGLESASGLSAAGIVTIQIKKSIDATAPDRAVWSFRAQPSNPAVEIAQADIAGVAFSPILRRPTPPCPTCATIHLLDSSRLTVKELKRRDDGRVECTLSSGIKLLSLDESDQFVASIAQITAQPSGVIWLSDLEPARYRLLESDSRVPWPLGRNQDLFGQRLFDATGHAIAHALVIHSPAQAAYRWDGKPARLVATLEILEVPASGSSGSPNGSIQGQVLVARESQLVKAWQSEMIRGGDAPALVDVDVSNAQLIVLLVDQADLGTLGDHALWRDVRIVPE